MLSLDIGSLSGSDGDASRSRTVKVKHGTTEILSANITDYTTGWNACKSSVTAGVSTPSWDSTNKKFTAYGYAYVNGTLQKTSSAGSSSALSLDTGSLSGTAGASNRSRTVKVKHGTTEILSANITDYGTGWDAGRTALWNTVDISYGSTRNVCSGYYADASADMYFYNSITASGMTTIDKAENHYHGEPTNIYKKGFAAGWQACLSTARSYWWYGKEVINDIPYWTVWTPKPGAYSSCSSGHGPSSSEGERWEAAKVRYYEHTIALKQQSGYAGASKMVMYFKDNNGNYQAAGGGASLAWYMSASSIGNTGSYKTFAYN